MGNEVQADLFGYSQARHLYEHNAAIEHTGRALQQARRELDSLTRAAVLHARKRRDSWSDIGQALGVSRQAVQKKYGQL